MATVREMLEVDLNNRVRVARKRMTNTDIKTNVVIFEAFCSLGNLRFTSCETCWAMITFLCLRASL